MFVEVTNSDGYNFWVNTDHIETIEPNVNHPDEWNLAMISGRIHTIDPESYGDIIACFPDVEEETE